MNCQKDLNDEFLAEKSCNKICTTLCKKFTRVGAVHYTYECYSTVHCDVLKLVFEDFWVTHVTGVLEYTLHGFRRCRHSLICY